MGMKSGRRSFNPVLDAGVDISAMLEEAPAEEFEEARPIAEGSAATIVEPAAAAVMSFGAYDETVQSEVVDEEAERAPVEPTSAVGSVMPKSASVAEVAARAVTTMQEKPVRSRSRRAREEWVAEEVSLEAGKAPSSGRYIWHIEKSVFELTERERAAHGIPTWGEYFIAILAQHARELDEIFPSLGYDLSVFGLGVMARRGYRKNGEPTTVASVYLPRGPQGAGIAEVIERYAVRARSKSAFAQQLVEHHLRSVGRM
jgi:hypothetical protein